MDLPEDVQYILDNWGKIKEQYPEAVQRLSDRFNIPAYFEEIEEKYGYQLTKQQEREVLMPLFTVCRRTETIIAYYLAWRYRN